MVALDVRRKSVAGASEPQARLMGQGADPSCPQRREIPQNLPISPSLWNFASPNTQRTAPHNVVKMVRRNSQSKALFISNSILQEMRCLSPRALRPSTARTMTVNPRESGMNFCGEAAGGRRFATSSTVSTDSSTTSRLLQFSAPLTKDSPIAVNS